MFHRLSKRTIALLLGAVMVVGLVEGITINALDEADTQLQIFHTPISQIDTMEGVEINATIQSSADVTAVVHYRYGNAAEGRIFESVLMTRRDGNEFAAFIPGNPSNEHTTFTYFIEASDTNGNRQMTGYADNFTDEAFTAEHWSQVPEQWKVFSDESGTYLKAEYPNTRNYLTQIDTESWTDYDVEFRARFSSRVAGSGEFIVRADETGDYYAIEMQTADGSNNVTFKIHYWEKAVYKGNLTANVTMIFDPTLWNRYRMTVRGNELTLYMNEEKIISAVDPNHRYPNGGIGFRSNKVGLQVADLSVGHPVKVVGFDHLAIDHEPLTEVPYNADIPVRFTVTDTGSPVTATIHYRYENSDVRQISLQQAESGPFHMYIPGTNRYASINYFITAEDEEGRIARFPETGDIIVSSGAFEPYSSDFEDMPAGQTPEGWNLRGDAKVVRLPEGNQVLQLNGQVGQMFPTATLSNPDYANIDNYILRFRAKYARTSDESYNVWRLRYRSKDDNNNYSMEWGTHNWRYFIMRKTELGGNYYLGTYNESLEDKWVDYEVRVSGITHQLFINGSRVINVDDFDELRLDKGYLQFGTVYGINLMIDSLEIIPLEPAHIYHVEPAGNYTGIYGQGDHSGLKIYISGGSEAHSYRIRYTVHRADEDKAQVASGEKEYAVEAYVELNEQLLFEPAVDQIGTYDVKVELSIDGEKIEESTKNMRIAIVREIAAKPSIDTEMQSKFGFNTHYRINWRDDIMDTVRKAGARHHRSRLDFASVYTGKTDGQGDPVFDFTESDIYLDKIASFGLNSIPVMTFIPETPEVPEIPEAASYEGLKLLERFAYESASHYKGRLSSFETPNEPELVKPYHPYEVVQQWKRAYVGMKKADPDVTFIAGDHTSSVRSILPQELELGAYNFADAFSWHPYVYNAMPDGAIEAFVRDISGMVNEYGGWKDFYITEGGWPTAKGGFPNVTEETQRDYITRAFLIYMTLPQVKAWQYYNFKNDGTDENYYEIFWGITDVDGRPKLAYGAVNNMMTTLDEALYVGRLDTQDDKVQGYVFMKDYKPVITAWRSVDHKDDPEVVPSTSQLDVKVGSSQVTVRDINGNDRIQSANDGVAQVTVSGSPVYILNASSEVLYGAAKRVLKDYYQESLEKIKQLESANNPDTISNLINRLGYINGKLESALQEKVLTKKAEGMEQGIKELYALMKEICVQVQAGNLDRKKSLVVMETLFYYADAASKPLIQVKNAMNIQSADLDYQTSLQSAKASYDSKTGDHHLLPVSTSGMKRVNRYARLAVASDERSLYAESYVYKLLAKEFAEVVKELVAVEQPVFIGLWLNITPVQMNGEPGYPSRVTGTVANETSQTQTIDLHLEVPDGWGESHTQSVQIASNDVFHFDLPINVPLNAAKGSYAPRVVVEQAGVVIDETKIDLRVTDGIQAQILPVSSSVEQLNEVTVQLEVISDHPKSGKVILRGPDGNDLVPATRDTFTNLSKGEVMTVNFIWDYKVKNDFNRYLNELIVIDTEKNSEIFKDDQVPLDFLLIQKTTEPMTIDGQLPDWNNAYPVHLRGSVRNNTGIYDPVNLDAVAYAMWDEQYFYIAVEVTDDIHKNSEDAPNMWKNDSVQFAFDPLNDSAASYNDDDMEWGFARHDDGTHLANIFFSKLPNPNGNVSSQLQYRINRDESSHKTYYEIRIPNGMIHHLQLGEGTAIGYNAAVNDADYQMGRDNFIQWTKGLADSKAPGSYDTFTFVNTN